MKKTFVLSLVIAALTAISVPGMAQKKEAKPKTVADVAMNSSMHTTLVTAVKAADLAATLKGAGPFTVFAPTNDAFAKLPAGTVDNLLKPENKKMLQSLLKYHVVAGKMTAKDVAAAIKKGNGTATLTTVQGGKLKVTMDGDKVKITDEKGGSAYVTAADMEAGNGVVHVIDTVLMPKK